MTNGSSGIQTRAAWDHSPQTLPPTLEPHKLGRHRVEKLRLRVVRRIAPRAHGEAKDDGSPDPLLPFSLYSEGTVPQPHPLASPQLPFAVLPILTFTSMPALMQEFANGW